MVAVDTSVIKEEKSNNQIASLNYAIDSLGMFRAELARILCLKCQDVSDSYQLALLLDENTQARNKARRFLEFFQLLEKKFDGDDVGLVHWFRKQNSVLGTTPLLAMVDADRLEDVIALLTNWNDK